MPLDVLGRTRYTDEFNEFSTLTERSGNLFNFHRAGDRLLQLLILNEEFLVSASHQLALITSLPFVHTARRYYRLSIRVKSSDRGILLASRSLSVEVQILMLRGSKSRNKVSVGEPAEGSLPHFVSLLGDDIHPT